MENLDYGGATTQLINLINSKNFRRVKFNLITNKNNLELKRLNKECDKNKVNIILYNSILAPNLKIKFCKILFLLLKPFLFALSVLQMFFLLKKINSDIFLANCGGYGDFRSELSGLLAARICGKKNLFLLIHHSYSKPYLWKSFVSQFLSTLIAKVSKGIIFVSKATKKNIKKNTFLITKSKPRNIVIHNGVNTNLVNRNKIKLFNTKKSINNVLMLSRIEKYKGHEDLIEAFSKIPKKVKSNFKIFFVGSGKQEDIQFLKDKIIELKLKKYFKLIKYLDYESTRIFSSVDIFFSLTRDFEGFGYSIAESLLSKTPVVSTNVGGVVEFLNKNNSVLIKPGEIQEISKVFLDFNRNKKLFRFKTMNGNLLIKKKFNSNIMGKKYYDFFKKCI